MTRLLLALLALASLAHGAPLPDSARQDGWFIGTQAWTFRMHTAFDAIARTKETGGKVIEIFPGQTLRPGSDVKVHHTMPESAIAELKAECERQGVIPVSYGVVGAKNLAEVRAILGFAKRLGLRMVTTESAEIVADWETGVREFDIQVGFHHHGGSLDKPGYKVWHPLYLLGVVESRDRRLGICADSGHWCVSNLDPVKALRAVRGRVISVHIKDKKANGNAADVPLGKGVVNVPAFLAELKAGGFDGPLFIEYENDWQDNRPQVAEGVALIRANPR
ncbi:MAG: sugar phosphate isomerase/epimerase family protein [Opitutia bacterium]|jgi:sugar phosphate isomerase/epimerase